MMLRIERSKGDLDRDVPLSPKLLETLREYWRWMRPGHVSIPGYRERMARGQADHAKSDLGSRSGGREACRHLQTGSPAHLPALCNIPDYASSAHASRVLRAFEPN